MMQYIINLENGENNLITFLLAYRGRGGRSSRPAPSPEPPPPPGGFFLDCCGPRRPGGGGGAGGAQAPAVA